MNLARFPRHFLAHLPTPLERLDRLSAELGGPEIWIKRDDCTGLSTGGNKTRIARVSHGRGRARRRRHGHDAGRHPVEPCPPDGRLRRENWGMACHLLLEDRTGSNDPNYKEKRQRPFLTTFTAPPPRHGPAAPT